MHGIFMLPLHYCGYRTMDSTFCKTIATRLVCFLMVLPNFDSFQSKDYAAVLSSDGSALCATWAPDWIMFANQTVQWTTELCIPYRVLCGFQCTWSPSCIGYNYRDDSTTCEFFSTVSRLCSPISECSFYQMTTLDSVPRKGKQIPLIPPENCSFPYTYNGQIFYTCASNVISGNVSVTDTCYWTYGCLLTNRTWAICNPPSTASTYVGSNSTLNLTIPTMSGTTIVQSLAGWIVFQQRIDGTLAFDQTWAVYKTGFGNYTSNYWMGLEKIYQLTKAGQYRLRLEAFANRKWTSDEYFSFYLDNEAGGYALHVSGYSGENGDVLRWTGNSNYWYHSGMKFSTKDVDNDHGLVSGVNSTCNPGMASSGGWWFNNCWMVNLNGNYGTSQSQYYLGGSWYNIQIARMMMKSV